MDSLYVACDSQIDEISFSCWVDANDAKIAVLDASNDKLRVTRYFTAMH